MNLTGGIVLYAVLWFLVMFILVPIRERSQEEAGEVVPGTPPGAPDNPRIGRKALWATLIAAVLWGICAWVILYSGITRADVQTWDQLIRR